MKTISLFVALFAFCIENVSAQTPNAGTSVAPASQGEKSVSVPATSINYVLQPTDAVQIVVYREPDLSTVARLSGDGSITFPLIGRVVLGGKTVQQAQDTICKMLGADYLVNPQVTLTVVEYTKQYFTVLGQVQHPGAYALPGEGGIPLLQAVGMAGGFTRIARTSHIVVKRKDANGKEKTIKVNANELATKGTENNCPIQAGDIISVPESIL